MNEAAFFRWYKKTLIELKWTGHRMMKEYIFHDLFWSPEIISRVAIMFPIFLFYLRTQFLLFSIYFWMPVSGIFVSTGIDGSLGGLALANIRSQTQELPTEGWDMRYLSCFWCFMFYASAFSGTLFSWRLRVVKELGGFHSTFLFSLQTSTPIFMMQRFTATQLWAFRYRWCFSGTAYQMW